MNINVATDPITWWENQITLHPPITSHVAEIMDLVRNQFAELGRLVIEVTPPGPDLTVALRALKDASQAAIANIACNQDFWDEVLT